MPRKKSFSDDHLINHGYRLSKTNLSRKHSLQNARKDNQMKVVRRLNVIKNLSRSISDNFDKVTEDINYLRQLEKKDNLKKNSKKPSKKKSKKVSKKKSKKLSK